jgi:hypothetical protein
MPTWRRVCAPHITVYTGQPGIDTTSASRELLAILARGLGQDSTPAQSDAGEQTSEEKSPPPALRLLGTQGRRFFALHAEAFTPAGAFVRDAVIELPQNRARPYTYLRWQRGLLREAEADPAEATLSPCSSSRAPGEARECRAAARPGPTFSLKIKLWRHLPGLGGEGGPSRPLTTATKGDGT